MLDSGSTDRTVEIVRRYTDRVWITDWPGYGPQKQRALEKTTCEWVLSIDADEELLHKVSTICGGEMMVSGVQFAQADATPHELKVDICNMCHPFFTGKLKYVDTAGRIEKFQNKFAAGSYASLQPKKKKKKPAKPAADS